MLDPVEVGSRDQQAVVGADEEPARPVAQRKRPARRADARVDDGEVHAFGHVVQRVPQHERALQDRLRGDPVREVDDLDLGRNALDHAVAGADEVVGEAEVRQERDEAMLHVRDASASTAATRPSRSCVSASPRTVRPTLSATCVVCGPIETAGRSPPIAAYARAAEPDASTTTSPAGGSGVKSRVLYSGTKSAPSASIGPRREFSAAANSTRPAGRGNSASRPSCDETRGTNDGSIPCSRSRSAVPGPTAATATAGKLPPRRATPAAPFAPV